MKKLKKLVAAIALVAMSIGVVGCSSSTDTAEGGYAHFQGDIARVGDVVITSDDVALELEVIEQLLVMNVGEDFHENEFAYSLYLAEEERIINGLIERELLLQDAKNQGIEVTDEEVAEELEVFSELIGGEEALDQALEMQGITRDAFEEEIKESLLIQYAVENIIADVEVADEDVKEYYEENKDLFVREAGANMAHILVDTEEEADKIRAEYEAGSTFEELASEYGTDGSAIYEELGFIAYASPMYDPAFLAGAVGLEEGEVSEPVESSFGYHLIQVTNVQAEDEQVEFDEIQEELAIQLLQNEEYVVFNEYMDMLGETADIEIFHTH